MNPPSLLFFSNVRNTSFLMVSAHESKARKNQIFYQFFCYICRNQQKKAEFLIIRFLWDENIRYNHSAERCREVRCFRHCLWQQLKDFVKWRYLFSTPDSERFAFLVVSGQSGFAACPPLRKLLKPSGEQALRPDFISLLGVLNNYKWRLK